MAEIPLSTSKHPEQKRADFLARSNPLRVVLSCKVLEFLDEDDLRTLIPQQGKWEGEYQRQLDAGEHPDWPKPENVRLETIGHLIEGLNALLQVP